MKMTKPVGYWNCSIKNRNEINRRWIQANLNNIDVSMSEDTVTALDKDTKEEIVSASVKAESIEYWKLFTGNYKEEFNVMLVGKNNDIMWYIEPVFGRKENGIIVTNHIEDNSLFMLKENIKQVVIEDFIGANDTLISLQCNDINGNRHTAVQYAFFSNLEDALKACEATPENGFHNWYHYIKEISNLIKYRYKVVANYKCGELIETKEVLESGHKLVTKASRLILNGLELTKIQTIGNLYNEDTHKYFIPKEEVLISFENENSMLRTKLTYKGQKVDIVCFDVIVDSKLEEI